MMFVRHNKLLCFLIVAVMCAGLGLVLVSQKVYDAQRSVKKMGQEALVNEWDIRSLRAELAYLTRPDRLDQISSAFAQSISPAAGNSVSIVAPVSFSLPSSASSSDAAIFPSKKPHYISVSVPQKVETSSQNFSDMLNIVGGHE
jgi:cell division protein FtsL